MKLVGQTDLMGLLSARVTRQLEVGGGGLGGGVGCKEMVGLEEGGEEGEC